MIGKTNSGGSGGGSSIAQADKISIRGFRQSLDSSANTTKTTMFNSVPAGTKVAVWASFRGNKDQNSWVEVNGSRISGSKNAFIDYCNYLIPASASSPDVPFIFDMPATGNVVIAITTGTQGGSLIESNTSLVAAILS